MKKRILASLLAICMALALMPTALAGHFQRPDGYTHVLYTASSTGKGSTLKLSQGGVGKSIKSVSQLYDLYCGKTTASDSQFNRALEKEHAVFGLVVCQNPEAGTEETLTEQITNRQGKPNETLWIGINQVTTAVTFHFMKGLKVENGGLMLRNSGYTGFDPDSKNGCMIVKLGAPITVGEDGRLYIERNEQAYDETFQLDTYIAPVGEPAIVVDGGTATIGVAVFQQSENDESSNAPLMEVRSGSLTIEKGACQLNAPSGIPEYDRIWEDSVSTITTSTRPAISVAEGATLTLKGGEISTSASGTPAITVAAGATLQIPEGSKAVVTASDNDTQAIDLASGSTVKKGDLEITVGTAGAGYVNNSGEIILPAGSTVTENNQTTTLPNGGTVAKDDTITENTVPVESVTLSQTTLTLTTGDTTTLTAEVLPIDATDKTVTWASSNEAVATVKDGMVTAISAGQAVITASAGDKKAECVVTVQVPYVPTPPVTPVQPVNPTPTPEPDPEPAPDPDPTPGAWSNPYADVSAGDWYYDAVAYVTASGLMTGTTASTFAPNDTMTRAMVWTVLARMSGQSVEGGSPWYALAQSWAMNATVSDGTGPNDSITREQLITMLYRQAGSPEVGVPELAKLGQFSDGETVSDWAQSAMAWAVSNGILTGDGDLLNPQAGATRAQVAVILMRFCQQ